MYALKQNLYKIIYSAITICSACMIILHASFSINIINETRGGIHDEIRRRQNWG